MNDKKLLKYIDYLVKENKDLQHRLDVAQGFLDRDVEYIETCKAVKENTDLKAQIETLKFILDMDNNELAKENVELKKQIEKMKNFYNCAHSSRALCPNEHKCKGCKDWEITE